MPGPRGGRVRHQWSRRRKRAPTAAADEADDAEEVRQFFEEALVLQPSPTTFSMDSSVAREQLADCLWQTASLVGEGSMTASNSRLAAILEVLVRNTYRSANVEESARRTALRLESLLVDLQRAQSQKKMPLMTVRFSVAAYRAQLPRVLWEIISMCFPGLLASRTWTESFIAFAKCRRPPCPYEELPKVGGVLFDNYQRRVLYSSKATVVKRGYLLDMTNWGSVRIPRVVAPANFDASRLCALSIRKQWRELVLSRLFFLRAQG